MIRTVDEIQRAISALELLGSDIMLLPDNEGYHVFTKARSHFVASGNSQFWWNNFRLPRTSCHFAGQGFKYIGTIVPDINEKVYFIVEESVSEATPYAIQTVMGGCYRFEYYIIARDFSWLICENHHDYIIAIGSYVEDRLRQLDMQQTEVSKN